MCLPPESAANPWEASDADGDQPTQFVEEGPGDSGRDDGSGVSRGGWPTTRGRSIYSDTKLFPERHHPHLKRNLLKEQSEACHRRGIRAPVYTTIQWDQFAA